MQGYPHTVVPAYVFDYAPHFPIGANLGPERGERGGKKGIYPVASVVVGAAWLVYTFPFLILVVLIILGLSTYFTYIPYNYSFLPNFFPLFAYLQSNHLRSHVRIVCGQSTCLFFFQR